MLSLRDWMRFAGATETRRQITRTARAGPVISRRRGQRWLESPNGDGRPAWRPAIRGSIRRATPLNTATWSVAGVGPMPTASPLTHQASSPTLGLTRCLATPRAASANSCRIFLENVDSRRSEPPAPASRDGELQRLRVQTPEKVVAGTGLGRVGSRSATGARHQTAMQDPKRSGECVSDRFQTDRPDGTSTSTTVAVVERLRR